MRRRGPAIPTGFVGALADAVRDGIRYLDGTAEHLPVAAASARAIMAATAAVAEFPARHGGPRSYERPDPMPEMAALGDFTPYPPF